MDADSHEGAPAVPEGSARGAGRVLGAAAGIGLLAQLLFWDVGWGINFPLTVSALLVAGWLCRDRALPPPRLLDAWIPFAALGLAAFVAIRGDVALVTLDVLGALALTGGAIASFGGLRVVERPFSRVLALGVRVAGWAVTGGRRALAAGANALPPGRARSALARHAPLIRGIALAIPAVLVFALLFMAADAVFAQLTTDLFDWDLDLGDAGGRLFLAAVVAWLAAGLLAAVAWPRASDAQLEAAPFAGRRRLGATESAVILIALDVLFVIFVIIQAAYLFGGLDTLAASGMTYAEYARRGFFELLAVAFLVAGLILALEFLIGERTRIYVGAAVVLVILTMVVLGSSFLRLRLYQDAYGWTELRFYVVAAIGWLALGTVATIWTLVRDQTRWLPHVMVVLAVLFGFGFNLIGPVRFIAEQNVARAVHPELVPPGGEPGLDAWYLSGLGTDADIVLVESLPDLPPAEQDEVRSVLEVSATQLETDGAGQAWQAWNASRERARALLVE